MKQPNQQMKATLFLIVCVFCTCSIPVLAQHSAAKKTGIFSFNINMSDYSFLKTVQDSSFTKAIKQKDWLKPGNKSFGIGASYWKGLTRHIDFSGTLSGTLSNFPKKFVKGDSIGQAGFSTQLDALLHFRLLSNKAAVNPFLTGGIGAGYFGKQVAAYAPVGLGLQLKFNEGGFMVVQAQWRKALTDGIANDYLMYSVGFIQRPKTTKQKKQAPKKEIPAPTTAPVVKIIDTDGDGVPDDKDNCINEKGTLNGCPDSDGDGIADKDDHCKNVPGVAKYFGCPVPDADKDGVPDEEDKCPNIAGTKENNGCPVIKAEVKQQVDMAAKQIFFAFASANIAQESLPALDKVVEIVKANPGIKLKIEAHSDNKGTFGRNIYWSEQRAKAVADYFISKGIAVESLDFKGYGDTQPVADNATEAGRAKNRRVEIKLSY
jgi:outer membrane protein OmpA-like peptidoglycan-associated protein